LMVPNSEIQIAYLCHVIGNW